MEECELVDFLFGITWLSPLLFTIIVSLLTSTLSQLSFAFFTNKDFIKKSREELKEMQNKLKSMKPEDEEYVTLQNKLLDLNMQVMTHSLKPTLINTIPFLVILTYAKSIIPLNQALITLPFSIPLAGASLEFVGVYFICSFAFSSILRKILGR